MEFVTPEEIARNILYEVKGGNTGHDIINALDNSVMGPTYRAGVMRASVLQQMKELAAAHEADSVAFELLGPPRLSKLLFEAHLLKLAYQTLAGVRAQNPEEMATRLEAEIMRNSRLRAEIISIGIPILLTDGRHLLRGPDIKIPPFRGHNVLDLTPAHLEQWAHDGWVDLRVANMRRWQARVEKLEEEMQAIPEHETSSRYFRNRRYWLEDGGIDIGKLVGWIFSTEEKGARMKE